MRMRRVGMAEEANYDHSMSTHPHFFVLFPNLVTVLTSDYAVLLAEELGFKPVVDDEAAFDIYTPFVLFVITLLLQLTLSEVCLILNHLLYPLVLPS